MLFTYKKFSKRSLESRTIFDYPGALLQQGFIAIFVEILKLTMQDS
ncbi:hypothetical protein ACEU2D_24380 [Brevibacillus laterosporus]